MHRRPLFFWSAQIMESRRFFIRNDALNRSGCRTGSGDL